MSALCVPSRLGKLEGSPLSDAHITLITSSLYKTRSIGMTKTGYLFCFSFYSVVSFILVFYSVESERCEWMWRAMALRSRGIYAVGSRSHFVNARIIVRAFCSHHSPCFSSESFCNCPYFSLILG